MVVDSRDPEGRMRMAEKEQEEEEAIVSIEAIDTVSCFRTRSATRSASYLVVLGIYISRAIYISTCAVENTTLLLVHYCTATYRILSLSLISSVQCSQRECSP